MGDTLRIDESFYPNCRWSFWFPDSLYEPDWPYPEDLDWFVAYPDSGTLGRYSVSLDSIVLPPGEYAASVRDFNGTLIRGLESVSVPARSTLDFELTWDELCSNPDHLELAGDTLTKVVILGQPDWANVDMGGLAR